jgi:hypothetical protein
MLKWILLPVFVTVLTAGPTFAAHPLITDDTGTQGKGKAQIEFSGEYDHDSKNGITTNTLVFPTIPVLSYGIGETVDFVHGVPYEHIEIKQAGGTTTQRGISDVSLQLKWRFFEKNGLSFAVKPGVTLPTGNEDKGLGNGKASYSVFFITTKDMTPWAFHLNAGYIRNEYKLPAAEDANRKDIWNVSLASQVDIVKGLKAVANIGIERNPDKTLDSDPAFLLGGFIYSITEDLDVDFGVKKALNKPETDIAYLAGVTMRF